MKNKILAVIILICCIIFIIVYKNYILKIFYPIKFEDIVNKYSKLYEVDKNLIFAVIKSESKFDSEANSHKGAKGLMQVMDETAIDISIELGEEEKEINLLDPETNIKIGTKYLKNLIDKYNNINIALIAYNAGIGNVDKWIEDGTIKKDGSNVEAVPFKETNNYVRSIINNYKIYQEIYE